MPRINLLPWRENLKKERELRFGIILGAALAVTALIVLGVHIYMESLIGYQQRRNNYLEQQIKEAEAQIEEIKELDQKKERLIARMNVIQKLEESRPQVVHLFDEMVKQVPEGVYFTSLRQEKKEITIEGIAQSDARVSSLMTNFEQSEWLKSPQIIYIVNKEMAPSGKGKNKEARTMSEFKLVVTQTTPHENEAEAKQEEE
ncbi:MAG: PilN domain-containing protein [Pseudomonadota bacterium]|nr:PilN domain-containing protein [Pseudomonadota bacterium]